MDNREQGRMMKQLGPVRKRFPRKEQPGIRILLVEDCADDARLLREVLAEAPAFSFELREARSLSAALSFLAVERYDVILFDSSLPDSRDSEGLDRITAHAGSAPVIVLRGDKGIDSASGKQNVLLKHGVDSTGMVKSILLAMNQQGKANSGT